MIIIIIETQHTTVFSTIGIYASPLLKTEIVFPPTETFSCTERKWGIETSFRKQSVCLLRGQRS